MTDWKDIDEHVSYSNPESAWLAIPVALNKFPAVHTSESSVPLP